MQMACHARNVSRYFFMCLSMFFPYSSTNVVVKNPCLTNKHSRE